MAKTNIIKLAQIFGAFNQAWQRRIDRAYEKEREPRDYMWASELGNSFYDRFLLMTGNKPTTPPNFRSQNKFKTGEMTEYVLSQPFRRCGVLKAQQERVRHTLPGCLMVSGKIDYTIGSRIDMEHGLKEFEAMGLPDFFSDMTEDFIEITNGWQELEEGWCELKTCSSMIFKKLEATHKPLANHCKQGFHYALGRKQPGIITYFCKDDSRMLHFIIHPEDKDLLASYEKDVKAMTEYYLRNEVPPMPPIVTFEDGKFDTNWHVEYSNFIDHFGFATPKEYRDFWDPKVNRWNRVLERMAAGKEETADNRLAVAEMTPYFPRNIKLA